MKINNIKTDNTTNQINKDNQNILLISNKYPNFQNQKTIIDNYNFISYSNYSSIRLEFESCYEIFKLKSINNAFYIAFPLIDNEGLLKINKYNYTAEQCEEVFSLQINVKIKKIKYFFEPLSKTEYLFINLNNSLQIYLIKNEKEYELVNEYKKEGSTGGYSIIKRLLPIYNFEIFYNKYIEKNFLIISFLYQRGCTSKRNDIHIIEFGENKLSLIKSFWFPTMDGRKLNIIYEDKIAQTFFLLIYVKHIIKYIEITDNFKFSSIDEIPNFFDSGEGLKKLNEIFPRIYYEYGCIISNNNNDDDYLYLCDKIGNLTIINLVKKEIIKQLNMNINLNLRINSIIGYNNKKIFFGLDKSFIIFDIDNYKIITKYNINLDNNDSLISVKLFNYENNKYYLFIDCSDKTIRLIY